MNDVRARMQKIGKAVDKELPKGWGFFVLCFPFNAPPDTQSEYVSNANREDVTRVMSSFIKRNPMQRSERN